MLHTEKVGKRVDLMLCGFYYKKKVEEGFPLANPIYLNGRVTEISIQITKVSNPHEEDNARLDTEVLMFLKSLIICQYLN